MTSKLSEWVARTIAFGRLLVQRALDTFPGLQRALTELVRIEVIDRCMIIAAQALLTVTPLFIVLGAFLPLDIGSSLVDRLQSAMGLDQVPSTLITQSQAAAGARTQTGIVGVFVVIFSALSFARSIQRMQEKVWERTPRRGLVSRRNCLVWLLGWLFYLELLVLAGKLMGADAWHPGTLVLQTVMSACFWCWTAHFLLQRRVPWAQLWCGAVLVGVSTVALVQGSQLVMPKYTASNIAEFGFFGLVFSMASWLIAFAGILVVGSILGRVISEDQRIRHALGGLRRRTSRRWSRKAARG